VTEFRDAFMRARKRLEDGADPEEVVPEVLQAAEAQEEIELAQSLYDDEAENEH
jgi:hypothetical protein